MRRRAAGMSPGRSMTTFLGLCMITGLLNAQTLERAQRPVEPDRVTVAGHIVRGFAGVPQGTVAAEGIHDLASPAGSMGGFWTTTGAGMNSFVNTIAVRDTDVFAGGFFTDAGGFTANYIARWNGSRWFPLGSGVNGFAPAVYAIAVSGNDVYAGGVFVTAGGQPSQGIARWDGTAWHALGPGLNGSVYAIAIDGTNVYAGGFFTEAGGVPARNIARWDGIAWHALGAGLDDVVRTITIYQGLVIAGGDFDSSGTTPVVHVARWSDPLWESLGGGTDQAVYALAIHGSDLIAGGVFSQAGGVPTNYIARWNGTAWSALGGGVNSIVYALASGDGGLYAGGLFSVAGDAPANQVARWDGNAWTSLYGGVNNIVFAAGARGSKTWFGGAFTVAGAQPAAYFAQWNEVNTTVLALLGGWNLLSLPRTPASGDPGVLFPGRTGAVFGYNNGTQNYESPAVLDVGDGYWVKYGVAASVTISGSDLDSITVVAVQPGWVLAGSVSVPVSIASLTTTPAGSIEGLVFRYNRVTQAYEPATEITPGEGYWVKVTQPCTIRIKP